MGSKQRAYTPEFREGAVRIVIETGRPIPEVAEELGIHSGTLHSWVSRRRRNGMSVGVSLLRQGARELIDAIPR
ncbi:transposase [Streptomyces sp. HUAS TT7]|uniref:transposase n=1 Tax=Streptomyces sp. HUAS TT7 TaxID=3447507 RepID=UPI003F6552F4